MSEPVKVGRKVPRMTHVHYPWGWDHECPECVKEKRAYDERPMPSRAEFEKALNAYAMTIAMLRNETVGYAANRRASDQARAALVRLVFGEEPEVSK